MYVCMFYIWHTRIRKQLIYTRPKTEARRREFQTYAAISNQDRADDILVFYVSGLACTHYLARIQAFDRGFDREDMEDAALDWQQGLTSSFASQHWNVLSLKRERERERDL